MQKTLLEFQFMENGNAVKAGQCPKCLCDSMESLRTDTCTEPLLYLKLCDFRVIIKKLQRQIEDGAEPELGPSQEHMRWYHWWKVDSDIGI